MQSQVNIEFVPVLDDPRTWSPTRKNVVLFIISAAAMIAGLGANIQNPAIQQMEEQLPASSSQISLSLSLFVLLQGTVPLLWSALSEIKGRKLVYILSVGLSTVGCIVTALAPNIGLVIGFRCLQGAGYEYSRFLTHYYSTEASHTYDTNSSASVISIGAATLADLYPPSIRGTKMGIYYAAPLLGPSLGPILGGALTAGFSWRACFWFMAIFSGLSFLSFLFFFKDTWRKERSLTYQNVLRARLRELGASDDKRGSVSAKNLGVETLPDHAPCATEIAATPTEKSAHTADPLIDILKNTAAVESKGLPPALELPEIKLSLKDVNPVRPLWLVLRRPNNCIILLASGSFFAFGFLISYTTARTLGNVYHYNALKVGLVLLSFGMGSLGGSLLGGRYSDYTYRKLKKGNGGKSSPEMRLKSTLLGLVLLPPSIIGFGWVSHQHLHISAICVMLFLNGFFSIWIYASTLAYIVDANNGRSSTAMASNSAFRGVSAFAATEIAVPLQDAVGDGWMYTIWGIIVVATELLVLLVIWKGGKWRERAEEREARSRLKQ
ncbi:vacuolar DHA amino acid exporter [Pleurotus eryngii]|uniref:Vacuolar DHA amino acid exporter n=1 Tax=Pleurotus eryngii TaxID=5323 RepID=A0A9P6A8W0_PLEER|nr:vacuolar DHA amino acid exporter [Pleurotus eryngii]